MVTKALAGVGHSSAKTLVTDSTKFAVARRAKTCGLIVNQTMGLLSTSLELAS